MRARLRWTVFALVVIAAMAVAIRSTARSAASESGPAKGREPATERTGRLVRRRLEVVIDQFGLWPRLLQRRRTCRLCTPKALNSETRGPPWVLYL